MIPNDKKLDRALRDLAAMGPAEAPAAVEAKLVAAFRKHHTQKRVSRWALAIAAVLLITLLIPWPKPVQSRKEVATRFYPLQDAENLPPFEYGTVVRVQLPRSALRVVGLPVNEDRLSERINADVLLGQDGLARAIRFVQ